MRIRPQDLAVDPLGRLQHVVVVVPVDREKDEAEHICQKNGQQRAQRAPVGSVRNFQLENEDRYQNCNHTVAERLEAVFVHAISP